MRAFFLTVSASARPPVNGHPSECVPHINRDLNTADFTQPLRVQAHRQTRKVQCKMNSFYAGIFQRGFTERRHVKLGHQSERPPLSDRELYTADYTLALRVRAHRTNPKNTWQAEFVVCEHFF